MPPPFLAESTRRDIVQPAFAFSKMPRVGAYDIAKRAIDVVLATLIVVVTIPIWVLVAIVIKLTSKGPVLYRGTVIGRGSNRFTYYKFRSMTEGDSDEDHRQFIKNYVKYDKPYNTIEKNGQESPVYKVVNQGRVTPVGQLIRRLSIDEMPQLINVIRGEMSLVGPRPPVEHEFELYDEWAMRRLIVLPGITGLYQVQARDRVAFTEMVKIDLEYIRRRSIWLDLWIMIRTPRAMLQGK